MLTVRPRVAELVFRVYGRALHPELFQVCASREVKRGDYRAKIDITTAGHVVTLNWENVVLTEVATAAHHPLPEQRRLLSRRLKGTRQERLDYRQGLVYRVDFQLEKVTPDLFWAIQERLADDSCTEGLLFKFGSSGRVMLGALSYLHFSIRERRLAVQALHTFPDDFAIVRTESVIELPRRTKPPN